MLGIETYLFVFGIACVLVAVVAGIVAQWSRVHVTPPSPEHELPPTPECFTVRTAGTACTIEHVRSGMGCLNVFLSVWLAGWTFTCAMLTYNYFTGGKMEDGSPMPLRFLLLFLGAWVLVAFWLLYSRFARKMFILGENTLRVETRLLWLRWSLTIPREQISYLKQVQDGGRDGDSFPSWGLKVKAPAAENTLLDHVPIVNRWGRSNCLRTVLWRLPYEQSEWLGIVIARWAGAGLELCPNPEGEKKHGRLPA